MDTITDLLPVASTESRGPSPAKAASRRGSRAPSLPRSRRTSRAPSLPRSRRSSRGPSLGHVEEIIGTPVITRDFAVAPPATVPHQRSRAFDMDFAAGPKSDPLMESIEETYRVAPMIPEEAETTQVTEAVEAAETTEGVEATEVTEAAGHAVESTVEETVAVVAATAVPLAVTEADAGADESITSVGQIFGLPVYDESTFVDSTFVDDSVRE